jgi:hypothetical protein
MTRTERAQAASFQPARMALVCSASVGASLRKLSCAARALPLLTTIRNRPFHRRSAEDQSVAPTNRDQVEQP